MSLSKFLKDVGRPVAYYPKLGRMLGSVNAAVFVCQFLYWTDDRTKDPDGWIYKTQAEIEEETGLTRRKQETVRAALTARGILEEMRRGNHGTLHFRINTARLDALWSQWLKTPMAESASDESTKAPNANGGKRQTIDKDTESTSETTPESTRDIARPRASFLPDWLPPKLWARWVTHLNQKHKQPTLEQMKEQIKTLDGFHREGLSIDEIVTRSIERGWSGFFKPEGKANGNGNGNGREKYRNGPHDAPRPNAGANQGNAGQWKFKNSVPS